MEDEQYRKPTKKKRMKWIPVLIVLVLAVAAAAALWLNLFNSREMLLEKIPLASQDQDDLSAELDKAYAELAQARKKITEDEAIIQNLQKEAERPAEIITKDEETPAPTEDTDAAYRKYIGRLKGMGEEASAAALELLANTDMDLVVTILKTLDDRTAGNILSEMDPKMAATILKRMSPQRSY